MKSKFIIISICALFLTGCGEDFLERTPQGVFTLDTYYNTTEEINTGLTYCYQAFWISEMQAGRFMVGNMMTQDATKGGASENEGIDIKNNIEYNILPNSSMAYRFWGPCYSGLTRANMMLEMTADKSFNEESPKGYNYLERMRGEMKFIRAFYSWYLVTIFGDVPYFTRATVSNITPDLYETVDRSKIWEQIEKDLVEAIPVLPKRLEYDETDVGRITRGAAQMLLARTYMFNRKYDDAAKVLRDLIENDTYSLTPDYADLFGMEVRFTPERIFEIPFGEQEFWRTPGLGGYGTVMPQFQTSRDDGGWGYNNPTQDLVNEFEEGDPRLIYTVICEEDQFAKGSEIGGIARYGYHNRKIYVPLSERVPDGNLPFNLAMFRIADAYLLYAEASLFGTAERNTDEAVKYINLVRQRASDSSRKDPKRYFQKMVIADTPLPDVTYTTDEELFKAIKHERRVELAMEDIRYWDMLRWGDLDTMSDYYEKWGNGPGNTGRLAPDGYPDEKGRDIKTWLSRFPEGTYPVFPIPQDAIQNSDNKIKQSIYY